MLTDEEIDALAGRAYPIGGPRLVALRHAIHEAVRLTAERCAKICDQVMLEQGKHREPWYVGAAESAQAIRARLKEQANGDAT